MALTRGKCATTVGVLILVWLIVCLQWQIAKRLVPTPSEKHYGYQYFQEVGITTPSELAHQFGAVSRRDARFISLREAENLQLSQIKGSPIPLLSSYFSTMTKLGISETWIAHGTLLGYHFGKHVLPWDTSISVQISIKDMASLVHNRHNMTVHRMSMTQRSSGNKRLHIKPPRTYLLDINPRWMTTSTNDTANQIDARWIDTANGKFVDITVLHSAVSGKELFCKNGYRYNTASIFPLSKATLDGVAVRIPLHTEDILLQEYGSTVLSNKHCHWHHFDEQQGEWLLD